MSQEQPQQLGDDYINLAKVGIHPDPNRYVHPNDRLYIAVWNSVSGLVARVRGVVLLKNGSQAEFNFRVSPTSDRVVTESFNQIPAGYLRSLIVFPEGSTLRGQTFVSISLTRDAENSNNRNQLLIQNYLQSGNALGFPGSKIQDSTEGPGVIRVITGTDPAAGAEITEAVPTNARWKLLGIRPRFVTSATAANRFVRIQYQSGTPDLFTTRAHDAQTASLNEFYVFAVNGEFAAAIVTGIPWHNNFLPDIHLPAAADISTTTTGIEVDDNYGAPILIIEEWIEE